MEKLWEMGWGGRHYLPSTTGLTRAQAEWTSASRRGPQTESQGRVAGSGIDDYEDDRAKRT